MILTASALDNDPQGMAMLNRIFRPALIDKTSVLGAIESLRLEAARPSKVCKGITDHFVVDLDLLSEVLAARVAA